MADENDSPGVYFLVNPDTKEVYIGSSGKILERRSQHEALLKRGKHPNKRLQNSYNQNSGMKFVGMTLPTRDEALDHEQMLLNATMHEPGILNISKNARYCRVDGLRHSDETKAKISAASKGHKHNLGRKHPPEFGARVSERLKGHIVSDETREKIRATKVGATMSKEAIEKMRQSKIGVKQDPEAVERRAAMLRGKPLTEEHVFNLRQANVKRFKSVSIDGVVYPSINEAARSLNLNPGTIYNRINSPSFPTWKYEESA